MSERRISLSDAKLIAQATDDCARKARSWKERAQTAEHQVDDLTARCDELLGAAQDALDWLEEDDLAVMGPNEQRLHKKVRDKLRDAIARHEGATDE